MGYKAFVYDNGYEIVHAVEGSINNSLYVEVTTDIPVEELNKGFYKLVDGAVIFNRAKFIEVNATACKELGIVGV